MTPEQAIPVPRTLLLNVLSRVRQVAELKIILYTIELASQPNVPAVPLGELLRPEIVRNVVGFDSPDPAEDRLRSAVDQAVANGHLLRITVNRESTYLLPATEDNRALIEEIRAGSHLAADELGIPGGSDVSVYHPNAFALYEHHIGPLTPLIAERLRDAERSYPRGWIEAAFQQAVEYNRRNWRYVETILAGWEERGGPDEAHGRRA